MLITNEVTNLMETYLDTTCVYLLWKVAVGLFLYLQNITPTNLHFIILRTKVVKQVKITDNLSLIILKYI